MQEAHIDLVACGNCESVYRSQHAGAPCLNCGATLAAAHDAVDLSRKPKYLGVLGFLKPIADSIEGAYRASNLLADAGGPSLAERLEGHVTCGWCSHKYDRRPESPNCQNCGGVLPMPPGGDPGPPPERPPRKLPRKFAYQLFVKQNVGGLFGLGFMLVALPFLLLPIVGIPLMLFGIVLTYSNFVTAYRRYVALARGVHRLGRIESVDRIGEKGSQQHGSVLYRVFFRFDVKNESYLAMKYTYDEAVTRHFVGQPTWVVYVSNRPKYYDLWPPLA